MNKTQFIAEPGKQVVTVRREFDAPRELVFKVITDPKLIPQWWGPRGLSTEVERMELKKGGIWRFIQRDPDGTSYAFNGVYHEVSAPERIINTFQFEAYPGHAVLETVTFVEHKGKTTLTGNYVYQTLEDRDGMVMTGMESGESESYDRLEELLKELKKEPQKERISVQF
jgi:uncharacterized protein YndB with AHSA1/START domain